MRKMSYRIEINRENGYFISNVDANVSWDDLSMKPNLHPLPISIQSVPFADSDGGAVADFGDCVSSLEDLGHYDPLRTVYFRTREEYLSALRGESEDWKLVGMRVDDVWVELKFAHKDGFNIDSLYLQPKEGKCLKILIEVNCSDGCTDRYLLYMENESHRGQIRLTEYGAWGYREIYFKSHTYIPTHPDSANYFYALVVDYKR